MTVVAVVDVPAEAIGLDGATDVTPDATVRFDRIVPVGESFGPSLWVTSDSPEAVASALRDADAVASAAVVERVENGALVHVEWHRLDGVFAVVCESNGVVREAVGEGGSWRLRLQFPTHDDLGAFYGACDERAIPVELVSVDGTDPPETAPNCLTDAQLEALTVALERGYFEVPRRATLADLAAELGVSDSAVSQRLRRGVAAVLVRALGEQSPPPE